MCRGVAQRAALPAGAGAAGATANRPRASASFAAKNRVIFNIKGNDYRLVVAVAYVLGAMYIKFVGTHEEYDAINVSTVEPKP